MNMPQGQQTPGMSGKAPRLTVIIVNYNSLPDILHLIRALAAEPEFESGELQVVVVDNASPDPIPEGLWLEHGSGLRLLLRSDNGGFAVGVNAGWQLAQSDWLLLLNPDVEIARGMISQVIERIDSFDRRTNGPPGIVGFAMRNSDGSIQGSVGVFPSIWRTIAEQFIPRSRRKYQAGWRIHSGPVDWVTGACMLVNARMMAELGGMDEDFFLYHEEVAFSRSAQNHGWRVEYDDAVRVIHRHPLQNRTISPKMRVIIRHSKLLYFRKYLPGWQFRGLSWIVSIESAARGLMAGALGRSEACRAWRAIRGMTSRLRAGTLVRGREALQLAEATELRNPEREGAGIVAYKGLDRSAAELCEPVPACPPRNFED